MVKKIIYVLIASFLMISCGSSKNISKYHKASKSIHRSVRLVKSTKKYPKKTPKKSTKKVAVKSTKTASLADKIIWTAVSYKGAPYKYGGTTKRGMDCSGLIYTSFKHRKVQIPRSSGQMYAKGYQVSLKKVKRGDLLFFKTARRSGRVNHVGLVTSVKNRNIRFIHASTSSGVMISSLQDNYWRKTFVKAKRVL
ncbi:C40 family peptidase [Tenacibaculum finnmarkense]|uniref:C40 family peptidase n=1 Tax=Tenacibaculum finnmarkense TaxID=2781243 RepID=UPI001EFB0746|nr:C40 family peptidase [Tenacibaculum finnmarkense]MCG8806920.1 C40 family peptidase [Tenacibaculum finnmarkense]MCG8817160.1 C40 family peptidase [Tenacibaculum finnmarkense]